MFSKTLWLALALIAVLSLTAAARGRPSYLITGKDIKPHSITSRHLVDHTIQAHDLSAALVHSLQAQTGPAGTTGPKGDTGATGAAGPQGPKGDTGSTGADGPHGKKGATGATGATGPAGVQGPRGLTGPAGPIGPKGDRGLPGLANVEADGPYPGRADSQNNLHGSQGDQSTAMWAADGTLQTSWVMCAPGKVALGGGFGQDDVQTSNLRIVTSSPIQIANGKTYLDDPSVYHPIDPEGSIAPNGWIVQGYNLGTQPLIVRPWVVCATVGH
jgi:hypothetical protein